jgi:hypothetical protein
MGHNVDTFGDVSVGDVAGGFVDVSGGSVDVVGALVLVADCSVVSDGLTGNLGTFCASGDLGLIADIGGGIFFHKLFFTFFIIICCCFL